MPVKALRVQGLGLWETLGFATDINIRYMAELRVTQDAQNQIRDKNLI